MKMKKDQTGIGDFTKFAAILIVVLLIWAGGWYWVDHYITAASSPDLTTRGQFGDQFGAVNALFSGFAFAGIIFTIMLQRSDLIETRRVMTHERFDTTFFELLRLHMSITEKIQMIGGKGKESFIMFHGVLKAKDKDFYAFCALSKLSREQIRSVIDSKVVDKIKNRELDEADINNIESALVTGVGTLENFLDRDIAMHESKIIKAYTDAAQEYIDDFAHYFRNLYNILKYIDQSMQISEVEKDRYSKFLRSQLSEAELIVLFYNSIARIELPGRQSLELGYPKMSRLLSKYEILQNMNPRSLIHPIHKDIFEKNTPKGTA
jgi:hypothetical protein